MQWWQVWAAPDLEGDDDSVRARTAHAILTAGAGLVAVALVVSVAMRPWPLVGHAPYAAMLALHVGTLVAVRRGAARAAVLAFAVCYVAMVLASVARAGGAMSPAGFALPPVVLFVGLTHGGRAAAWTAAASALGSLGIVLLARAGELPAPTTVAPLRTWLVATTALGITAYMLHVALRVIRASRAKALADQRARHALEERLHQTRRLESVGRLAAGVAHDFNNVLTVVLGEAARLRRGADARTLASATSIQEAAERAAALTRQLLAFGRRQVRDPEPVSLADVVEALRGLLTRLAGDDLALELELAPGLPAVLADRSELEQVLLNLVTNARDATPAGGHITIRTGRADDARRARAAGELAAGDAVYLEVADTGAGMSAEVQAHIFEPFFTTKPLGRGTGLGLATVHGIVTAAGGAIAVTSAPGDGTTFTILWPVAAGDATARAHARGAADDRARRRARVVLVDDDALVRAAVAAMLVDGGHEVVAAGTATEVLAAAASWAPPPELAVLDVLMPDVPGPEVARRLRAHHPALRVLFVSGHTEDRLGDRGVLLADVHLLAKPFDRDALLARIDGVLAAPAAPVGEAPRHAPA